MGEEHRRGGPLGPVVHSLRNALPHARIVDNKASREDDHGHTVDLRKNVPQLGHVVSNHVKQALRNVLVLIHPRRP